MQSAVEKYKGLYNDESHIPKTTAQAWEYKDPCQIKANFIVVAAQSLLAPDYYYFKHINYYILRINHNTAYL